MTNSDKLRMYGENAATFLIFQALSTAPGAMKEVFLDNLKHFGQGNKKKWKNITGLDTWLFANFGKRHGFGEPDVLILAGGHVFWIEVETKIDCHKKLPALEKSLLQMWRFSLLQSAITEGPKKHKGSLYFKGKTLTDKWEQRPASVALKGHRALQQVWKKIKYAGHGENDHYVLFSINKPSGAKGLKYGEAIKKAAENISQAKANGLSMIPVERCWYAHWESDLKKKFTKTTGHELDLDAQYVRIKG